MRVDAPPLVAAREAQPLRDAYACVRAKTLALCANLQIEDYVVQSMADASPVKWHLAHTTWFFERFVLQDGGDARGTFDSRYDYLFNSYYDAVGARHPRASRGLLSRPTVNEVLEYRTYVDRRVRSMLESEFVEARLIDRIELGLHHEQQHQELMLTDLKHAFSANPLEPAYLDPAPRGVGNPVPLQWKQVRGGLHEIGAFDKGFCFDNEKPRHRVYVHSFELASRPVLNREYADFVLDGGYSRPELWLSDGWACVTAQGWRHPAYWSDSLETEFTLEGRRQLHGTEPVCHVSYFEADAYARWAQARLPTEAEWEIAAPAATLPGNFANSGRLHPVSPAAGESLQQMLGGVWEWTASAYSPYPDYRPAAGAIGEYNGKFMANQYVLRGGSCATPLGHVRASYRNFFYPHQRWQFSGLRLARSL